MHKHMSIFYDMQYNKLLAYKLQFILINYISELKNNQIMIQINIHININSYINQIDSKLNNKKYYKKKENTIENYLKQCIMYRNRYSLKELFFNNMPE